MLVMAYGKYFPAVRLPEIKQMLEQIGPDNASQVLASGFKDPMTALVLGLFLGGLGVDRFYIGDNSIGALKLVVFIIGWVIAVSELYFGCISPSAAGRYNTVDK